LVSEIRANLSVGVWSIVRWRDTGSTGAFWKKAIRERGAGGGREENERDPSPERSRTKA
jgi:hypothetical protein